ncbi:hypothetical protein IQ07DRAFT_389098 [Pyrenochaeta sp. DS3sAY3a]|nr:hypothetical protein IQ07DRAFT_389098 [Pyrenochaeta sp. DS3sAY3a]
MSMLLDFLPWPRRYASVHQTSQEELLSLPCILQGRSGYLHGPLHHTQAERPTPPSSSAIIKARSYRIWPRVLEVLHVPLISLAFWVALYFIPFGKCMPCRRLRPVGALQLTLFVHCHVYQLRVRHPEQDISYGPLQFL